MPARRYKVRASIQTKRPTICSRVEPSRFDARKNPERPSLRRLGATVAVPPAAAPGPTDAAAQQRDGNMIWSSCLPASSLRFGFCFQIPLPVRGDGAGVAAIDVGDHAACLVTEPNPIARDVVGDRHCHGERRLSPGAAPSRRAARAAREKRPVSSNYAVTATRDRCAPSADSGRGADGQRADR